MDNLKIALVIKWQRQIQGSRKKTDNEVKETMDLVYILKNVSLEKGKEKYYKSQKAHAVMIISFVGYTKVSKLTGKRKINL